MRQVIDVRPFVKTPIARVVINWEVDGSSGQTICEAWRGQYEIERLAAAGYIITDVKGA